MLLKNALDVGHGSAGSVLNALNVLLLEEGTHLYYENVHVLAEHPLKAAQIDLDGLHHIVHIDAGKLGTRAAAFLLPDLLGMARLVEHQSAALNKWIEGTEILMLLAIADGHKSGAVAFTADSPPITGLGILSNTPLLAGRHSMKSLLPKELIGEGELFFWYPAVYQ